VHVTVPPTTPTARLCQALTALLLLLSAAVFTTALAAQSPQSSCADCVEWNKPQAPLRLYGNTYYVGVHGLSAILITSPAGHVLVDAALPESAAAIEANIRALGFEPRDIKLIVNSHVHFDHAGGIARLQAASGAEVAALPLSAEVLRRGPVGRNDPQFGSIPPIAPVARVRTIRDGETLRVGPIAITAHATGGHTPGSTTWTWQACDGGRCLDIVYADSLTPVSSEGFRFTSSRDYPTAIADFQRSFRVISALPCDVLLTPHPDASDLWARVAKRDAAPAPDALVDRTACARYADGGRRRLDTRVAGER
jgi:metallo-beta-lactamase class B